MKATTIPLDQLEKINDMLADGIDAAGEKSELFLTKLAFFLAAHHVSDDQLKEAIEISLRDLGA